MSHRASPRTVHAVGLSPEECGEVITAHRRALASGEGVLKDGRRTAVTRIRRRGQWLCVKEYRSAGLLDRIKGWLRGPRARRAWRGLAHLAAHGVATPEPLALLEERGEGYLVTRFVEGASPLGRLLRTRFGRELPAEEVAARRAMVRQLAVWLRRVHKLGIYHDDWSIKNILAGEEDGQWCFRFLDFESVVPGKRLTYRRRVKNLAQLSDAPVGITRTDRMRFLVTYAGGRADLTGGRFPHDVLAATTRRLEEAARTKQRARRRHLAP